MRRLAGYVAFSALMLSGLGIVTLVRIRQAARSDHLEPADAIVVFGAAVWESGPSTTLRLRVRRAADLYAQGLAPVVVCSGGTSGGKSEPRVMAELLASHGVPAAAVVLDEAGVNTRATVRSLEVLGSGRWRKIIAVSSPFHLFRIVEECARRGFRALPCAARRCPQEHASRNLELLLWDARQYGREAVAVWTYRALALLARAKEAVR